MEIAQVIFDPEWRPLVDRLFNTHPDLKDAWDLFLFIVISKGSIIKPSGKITRRVCVCVCEQSCLLRFHAIAVPGGRTNTPRKRGGSGRGLISTRPDVKNVGRMFPAHGSDQDADLRVTCNH